MDLFGDEPEEEFEEADEIEAAPVESADLFAHPRTSKFSLGHEAVEQQLLDLYNRGRLPHGLIFAGPKGMGKATMAYRLARFLLKNGIKDPNQDSLFGAPEPLTSLDIPLTDPVFSRVASGGHSDFLTIERLYDAGKDKYKNSVEVDEIRKVAPFLRMTASDGGWRIVIVDDADTMNRNAQNALLKILEEPPQNALLILVTHRAGALIPTIKSRTQTLNFKLLQPDTVKTLLDRQGQRLSSEEFSTLNALAGGSFGRALQIMEAEGIAMSGKVLDLLENFPQHNWVEIHKFADGFGFAQEGFSLFAEITNSVFRDLARAKARGAAISGYGVHKPMMQKIVVQRSLQQILAMNDNLQGHFVKVEQGNLDRRQGVLSAFSLIS
jgi:DNA polymerase-3 subunit delta'